MGSDSPWANHRNAKTTRGERVSNWVSDQIDAGGPNRRHANAAKASRDAAKGMESASGGSTSKRQKLSWADKRAADRVLKAGKPDKKGKK